jgi:hypothetical protein
MRSNEWQMAEVNTKWKNNRRSDTRKSQQITTIVNQFAVLRDISSDCDQQKQLEGINKKQIARNRNELRKKKIVLMGDSHVKGYASELLNQLNKKFEIMGMVMPVARFELAYAPG